SRPPEQVEQVRRGRYPAGRKRCPTCRQDKALDEFYTSPSQPDGLGSQCADCNSAGVRRSAAKNKARPENALKALWTSKYPDGLRKCRGGHTARLAEFGRNAKTPDGLRVYCRACDSERAAAYHRREVEQQWAD